MTWDAYNRRKEALREALAIADRRQEEVSATELLGTVEGASLAFANEAELLLDVQMTWNQRLSGQLDRTLTVGAGDLETFVTSAWTVAATEMPGARALLDASADLPELQKAFTKELELLGWSAGTAGNHPDLIGHGQRIKESARKDVVNVPAVPDTPARLFARIHESRVA